MKCHIFNVLISVLVVMNMVLIIGACSSGTDNSLPGNGDGDTDTDSDSDADGDSDTDSDGDTDTDSDSDSDTDSDGDTDSDSDSDGDTDSEDTCYEMIDIVFVLDVSTTMASYLETLEEQIHIVWDAAQEIDDDPHFGLVVFVNDVTVSNEGKNYETVDSIKADFHTWWNRPTGEENNQTQTADQNWDYYENTLDALHAAASNFEWRDQEKTLRVIIHATDDSFYEAPMKFDGNLYGGCPPEDDADVCDGDVHDGIQVAHTYEETLGALQDGTIRVATFYAPNRPDADAGEVCLNDVPCGEEDLTPGFASHYGDSPSLPDGTSGKNFLIDEVGSTITLADAINDFVIQELCEEYIPIE